MQKILLTQSQYTLVNDEDFEYLNQWKWCAHWSPKTNSFYAVRNEMTAEGKYKTVRMHRVIMKEPVGKVVDHDNHNTLDNRKENLRVCEQAENMHNFRRPSNNTSGYKGVTINRQKSKSRVREYITAQIGVNGKVLRLGYYKTLRDAARAYNEAAIKYFGEFALLNEL